MTTNEHIALTLAVALMTGKRASQGNADRAIELFRFMLAKLDDQTIPPRSPTDYEV